MRRDLFVRWDCILDRCGHGELILKWKRSAQTDCACEVRARPVSVLIHFRLHVRVIRLVNLTSG
jgi:hypothetical protein